VPNPFLPLHPSLAAASGGRTRLRQDSSCSFFRGVRRVRSDPACTSAMLVKLWDFCRIGVSVFFSASLCAVHSDTSDTTPASTERWCKWAQAVRPATVAKVNMTSGSTETVLDRGSVTACRETRQPCGQVQNELLSRISRARDRLIPTFCRLHTSSVVPRSLFQALFKPYIAAFAAFEIEDRRDAQRDTRNQGGQGDSETPNTSFLPCSPPTPDFISFGI
jgi:hypothetical protein